MQFLADHGSISFADRRFGDDANMFEAAPVSLWLEDYSDVKALFDAWRRAGVKDLRAYLAEDRDRVTACVSRIRVIRVNRRTLSLFEADDLAHLVANLDRIFRDDMLTTHVDELAQLWDGQGPVLEHSRQLSRPGSRLDIQLKAQHPARLRERAGRASWWPTKM